MNRPERRKKWARRIGFVVAAGLFGLFAAELVAQAVSGACRQRVMTYDAVVGWRPIPNSHLLQDAGYGSYRVNINSRGLRDREHDFENPDDRYRVVVIGDSLAFGYGGVEQQDVFTEVMQQRLKDVEFINLGVPTFSTDQEYLYLKEHGLKYQPDLVVLCVYQDDFHPTFESFVPTIGRPKGTVRLNDGILDFRKPEFPWYYLLVEHSVLAGYLDAKFQVVNWLHGDRSRVTELTLDEKRETYLALLAATRDLCHTHNCDFMVVNQPGYAVAPENDHARRIVGEFAREQNVPLLDLNDEPPFQEPDAEKSYVVGDHIHPNAAGHRLIAELLRKFLATATGRDDLFTAGSVSASGAPAGERH